MEDIILGLGVFIIFFSLVLWLRNRSRGKKQPAKQEPAAQKSTPVHKPEAQKSAPVHKPAAQKSAPAHKPAALDANEAGNLGLEAAKWCRKWMQDSSADHKWLVIEVAVDKMDCRSTYGKPPYSGYPHCTIQYSRKISQESRGELALKILSVIKSECPDMVTKYGLFKDGGYLILPTNYD